MSHVKISIGSMEKMRCGAHCTCSFLSEHPTIRIVRWTRKVGWNGQKVGDRGQISWLQISLGVHGGGGGGVVHAMNCFTPCLQYFKA